MRCAAQSEGVVMSSFSKSCGFLVYTTTVQSDVLIIIVFSDIDECGSDNDVSSDIDECAVQAVQCGVNQMCFNTRGSYQCLDTPCPAHYRRGGTPG